MDSALSPAIVIAAYNRPASISRLLSSIAGGKYAVSDITLIISIDYQQSAEHSEVLEIAHKFNWNHGKKVVIEHKENLGLRKHIVSCGDLSKKYGAVIILEDDLLVSPFFHDFASKALQFYSFDERIGGISLYNHKRNFCVGLPFELIAEHSDNYFLQIASSWGQAWTYKQWVGFREWYDKGQQVKKTDLLPTNVINWPETSWLKYFIKYLVETDRYFVYPKLSYSSNFGDNGTHHRGLDATYQVPLVMEGLENFRFVSLESSINVYDSHFELLPSIVKKLSPHLSNFDFLMDSYGHKNLLLFPEKYAISSKPFKNAEVEKSFGLSLKPMIMNIIFDTEGKMFHLANRTHFDNECRQLAISEISWNYFYRSFPAKDFLKLIGEKILKRITRKSEK